MTHRIAGIIAESLAAKQALLSEQELLEAIERVVELVTTTYRAGGKVLFCGNGGSAADAQHLAAELSGRFYLDRAPLFAEALHVNTSFLTAVGNDYGFDRTYARAVEAMGRPGDVLFSLSTSGNSPNVVNASKTAQNKGMAVVGMTGRAACSLDEFSTIRIKVPSDITPRIQECHILLGHIVCELVEGQLFGTQH